MFKKGARFIIILIRRKDDRNLKHLLKLWDEDNPPQLIEIEELDRNGKYGVRLRFELGSVSLERWEEKKERLRLPQQCYSKDLYSNSFHVSPH